MDIFGYKENCILQDRGYNYGRGIYFWIYLLMFTYLDIMSINLFKPS